MGAVQGLWLGGWWNWGEWAPPLLCPPDWPTCPRSRLGTPLPQPDELVPWPESLEPPKSRFPRGQITPLNPEHPLPESHPQPLRPASAALPHLGHHPRGPRGRCGLHERLGSRARPAPGKPSSCCFSGHSPAFPGSPRLHAPLGFGLLACPESLTS